ncbi:MAG: metal ABC transporter substrate-binding protein [Lachnospiraceae bacterium]|nr:metal ABC transporter substrate-binding protein [Lachnospiraceae bacterium]
MKKIFAVFASAILAAGVLSGCGSAGSAGVPAGAAQAAASGDRLQIVTTIFPEYDWVREILGDRAANADVTLLLDNGADLHSYQPTADDILKVSTCDLFIYVGGESDEWVEDALETAANGDMIVINLLETLGDRVKEEEIVEGMEAEHDHDHGDHDHDEDEDHDHDEDEDHDHDAEEEHDHDEDADHDHEEHDHEEEEEEMDEHVWLSLQNAEILCDAICGALKQLDPAGADAYQANADAYREKLAALDTQYAEAVSAASVKTVLFGDRFPFRYLVDDYGLSYYAAFVGCSAETEASFETIVFLSGKVDELGLPAVMTIEGPDHRIAETIRDNTAGKDQKILTLDSLQATTSADGAKGTTYLSVMTQNLEVLKQALQK